MKIEPPYFYFWKKVPPYFFTFFWILWLLLLFLKIGPPNSYEKCNGCNTFTSLTKSPSLVPSIPQPLVFMPTKMVYLLHIWCEPFLLLQQFWHLLVIFSDYWRMILPSQNLWCDHIRSLCLDDQRQCLTIAEERTLDTEYLSLREHLHLLYWGPHICKNNTVFENHR